MPPTRLEPTTSRLVGNSHTQEYLWWPTDQLVGGDQLTRSIFMALLARNHLLFADSNPRKDVIFDEIVLRSFNWCLAREMLSMQNKNDFASTINKKGRVSNETNFQDVSSNDINKWKSSSSTRFKTPFETPSFKNQWNIKRNFKSPLIPRELFSNETPVSSPRWNSTSLHRLDTTFNWFSKFGKPVSTVLKWVPKVVV
ncbi:hypothetical protein Tco_1137922 [Tanacetum coccineum]